MGNPWNNLPTGSGRKRHMGHRWKYGLQYIHLCDEVHISHINNNEIGDTKFVLPTDYKGKLFDYYFEETKR